MPATLEALAHVHPHSAAINDSGHLTIGGCDLVELAREFGTPAYVVDEDDLRGRAREAREALSAAHPDSLIVFASKAFPCTAVLAALAGEGLGVDVASGGELALALAAGFDPAAVVMHGNARSEREFAEALAAGVGYVVLDSFDDIVRLAGLGARRAAPAAQRVLLRINPDVSGDTHHAISTGQADSKFGFSLAEADQAIAAVQQAEGLELCGLHCHIGSQLLDLAPFPAAARALAALGRFPVVDLGGGLGVAYTREQRAPALRDWVRAVAAAAGEAFGEDRAFRLLLEPGRALVANSTVTIYTVETVKRNVRTWVAVDGGMSDNLRPMLYGARYEAELADRPLAEPDTRCHVAGKHCESGDVLIDDVMLHSPRRGDILVTPATGAYGYAMANNYNGVPRPPVILCRDGSARVVVRRESYEDLMARDIAPAGALRRG